MSSNLEPLIYDLPVNFASFVDLFSAEKERFCNLVEEI